MSATRPEKLNKLLSYAMIHIHVGNDLKDFGVHKDLVCHHSPYFKAALNSGFEEATTGIIKFPEVKVEVFELFYHWLYTQDLHLPLWDPTKSSSEEDTYSVVSGAYDGDSNSWLGFTHNNSCPLHLFCKKQLKLLSKLLIIDMMVWEAAPEFSLFVPNPIPTLVLDEVHSTMRRYFRAAVHKTEGALSNPLWNIENYLINVDEEEDDMFI
ncbi:uncharacterized protein Bfra_011651 [Botrytis fragariae]|uniref:BTB domain-containing protein n=1 Tax=Botrytis fragariae TaxID=1964551 RepID=A0A8H6AJY2_9HELO|nr:uncharacterized protein Bfra_011651 [Botrytis fragariae]KAF5869108.1 hypothetical protein Bfra_011651 [Botrytis fragariae]